MTSTKRVLIVAALLAVIGGAFVAWRAYKRDSQGRKLSDKAALSRTRAEHGDVRAEVQLASMYYYGRGVPQDYAEAVRWYRKAADQSDAEAEYYLGFMYHEGKGIPRDTAESGRWCRKAADQGYGKAEFALGNMYHEGKEVSQDYAEAGRWYRKAADQGDPGAQAVLGYMYYSGQGLQQDYSEAIRWYHKSADQGNSDAQAALGYMYYEGQGVGRDYAESRGWYRKSANQGNAEAQRALKSLNSRGGGLIKLRYLELLVAFLGGSWFSLDFLLPGRSIRDWKQVTLTFLGILSLSYVGLSVYGIVHDDMWRSPYLDAFGLAKRLLAGAAGLTLVALLLAPKRKQLRPK